MGSVYFDASALVKLFLFEQESEVAQMLWSQSEAVISSRLAYPEVCAGIGAAARAGRISASVANKATASWTRSWDEVRHLVISPEVVASAGRLAQTRSLSGADAVHLASVLTVNEPDLLFAVWDVRLRDAAAAEGVQVVPTG
jgi:predicted nucleic acid-binding protein